MTNNFNRHPKVKAYGLSKAFGLKPMKDYETLMASGATRIISAHSSAWAIPIKLDQPELGFVLVDAGMNEDAKEIRRYLATQRLGLDAVKAVIITHAHVDHVAGLHAIDKNVRTLVAEGELPSLMGERGAQGPLPGWLDRSRAMFGKGPGAHIPGVNPEKIEFGKIYSFGDELSIRPVLLEGHTDASTGVLVNRNSWEGASNFLQGDAFDIDKRGRVVNAHPWFTDNTTASGLSIVGLSEIAQAEGWVVDEIAGSHSGIGKMDAVHNYKRAA